MIMGQFLPIFLDNRVVHKPPFGSAEKTQPRLRLIDLSRSLERIGFQALVLVFFFFFFLNDEVVKLGYSEWW